MSDSPPDPSARLLVEAFGRIPPLIAQTVEGLDRAQLGFRSGATGNSIAWLVWHLTRVQDDHVADAMGVEQVWTASDWRSKFGLPFEADATGYGFSATDVGRVDVGSPALLTGYLDEVSRRSVDYVAGLTGADLDRVVDENWDPPVTLGIRLVSVVSDDLQHAGQAAFVRGLLEAP